MADVDVGLIADLRFPGGASTALENELHALRRAGLSAAILFTESPVLARARAPNPSLCAAIAETGTPVLSGSAACRARLILVHHPATAQHVPSRRGPLTAPRLALVAHHPAADRDGVVGYDYARACRQLRLEHGVDPVVLPVGPAVRRSLRLAAPDVPVHAQDWPNMIDLDRWPQRAAKGSAGRLLVGRHSRPSVEKWPSPETAAAVYPERPDVDFAFLGVDHKIRSLYPHWPATWQGLPFRPGAAAGFLAELDAYAYFHAPGWTEAFGYSVLEALATGLPTILPPHFRETFGTGPIYAAPPDVAAIYDRMVEDPAWRAARGEAACEAAQRFDIGGLADRIDGLLAGKPARGRVRPPQRADTALVVTSNGIGTGHLARQIAIARAQPIELQTVFFTLSVGAALARQAGFLAEHRPFHRGLRLDPDAWNAWFQGELTEALRFYRPSCVIFDGNMPYTGLVGALAADRRCSAIWVRRGMWRHANPVAAERSLAFDLVLEPGEVADGADPGHMRTDSAPTTILPPVLSVPPRQRLGRAIARRLLGLPEEGRALLMALGAGQNHDIGPAREATLAAFADWTVFEPLNPVAPPPSDTGDTHLRKAVFPLAKYLAAFDGAVSAAGYNSFHELISARLPTLFVPNTAPEMDLQEARADFAATCGWALSTRAHDPYGLRRGLAALADPDWRDAARARMASIQTAWDGAERAADLIALTSRRRRSLAAA